MADQLFVYGTLHPNRAPAEIADVVSRLRPAGRGTIQGTMYELEEYPAVLHGDEGRVKGHVFTLPSDPEALRRLDKYEEYDRRSPSKSLFRRRKATVRLSDGRETICWVYFYSRAVPRGLQATKG